jgi:hypothetical protein
VLAEQAGEIEVGQHVAVHHEEVGRQRVLHHQQWADGAEWRLLHGVLDVQAPLAAVADVGADELAEVPDGQRHGAKALLGQLPHDDLEDRVLVPDRNQRFGQAGGVGPQSDAFTAGQDHRMHELPLCLISPSVGLLGVGGAVGPSKVRHSAEGVG